MIKLRNRFEKKQPGLKLLVTKSFLNSTKKYKIY